MIKIYSMALLIILLAGCVSSPEYTADSSAVLVVPTKGWYKPGVSGKDAYLMRRQCLEDAKKQPGYLDAKKIAASVVVSRGMTNEERRKMFADSAFIGKYTDVCMTDAGFKYMKYPRGESVYVPPPPPRKAWVKPGVGYVEARAIGIECAENNRGWEKLSKCMEDQGFVFRELTEDELPPCWYAGHIGGQCKDEPQPQR